MTDHMTALTHASILDAETRELVVAEANIILDLWRSSSRPMAVARLLEVGEGDFPLGRRKALLCAVTARCLFLLDGPDIYLFMQALQNRFTDWEG